VVQARLYLCYMKIELKTRQPEKLELEVHSHHFVSGPRATAHYASGKWVETKFTHSHPGGGIPHEHPHTGPAFYGYRKPKITTKATGEQFQWVAIPEERLSFDLVITDSAMLSGKTPIGDTPLDQIFMPAADRMMSGFRMKCIVRDERKGA
jgi:hypothetical protein